MESTNQTDAKTTEPSAGEAGGRSKREPSTDAPKRAAKRLRGDTLSNSHSPIPAEKQQGGSEKPITRSFPEKLLEIVDNPENSEAIWWLPTGTAICISPKKFCSQVLEKNFQGTKFDSFTRRLTRHGFARITADKVPPGTHVYFHDLFLRGKPELLDEMKGGKKYVAPSPRGGRNVAAPLAASESGMIDSATGVMTLRRLYSEAQEELVPQRPLHQQEQELREPPSLNLSSGEEKVSSPYVGGSAGIMAAATNIADPPVVNRPFGQTDQSSALLSAQNAARMSETLLQQVHLHSSGMQPARAQAPIDWRQQALQQQQRSMEQRYLNAQLLQQLQQNQQSPATYNDLHIQQLLQNEQRARQLAGLAEGAIGLSGYSALSLALQTRQQAAAQDLPPQPQSLLVQQIHQAASANRVATVQQQGGQVTDDRILQLLRLELEQSEEIRRRSRGGP